MKIKPKKLGNSYHMLLPAKLVKILKLDKFEFELNVNDNEIIYKKIKGKNDKTNI